jgi:hypothetical protein
LYFSLVSADCALAGGPQMKKRLLCSCAPYMVYIMYYILHTFALSISLSHTLSHTQTHAGGPQKKRRLLCSCAPLADSSVRSWRGPSHGRCVATPPRTHTPCLSLSLCLCVWMRISRTQTHGWMRAHTYILFLSLARAHTQVNPLLARRGVRLVAIGIGTPGLY